MSAAVEDPSEFELTRPRVFIIARDQAHRRNLKALLTGHFDIKAFEDTHRAGEAIAENPPDVTVVDIERVWQNEVNWLTQNAARVDFRQQPLLLIGMKGDECKDMLQLFGATSRHMTWPISSLPLIATVSDLINQAVEASWEKLPEVERAPLKMTVEEYLSIATAIEKGEPISYSSANVSCAPQVDAVRCGAHHGILKTVQSHHNYTYVHSMRVATLLTLFGHGIGMEGNDLRILSTGGLLHDVGKLVTPLEILDKPGKLDEDEWPVMQNHVVRSGDLLGDVEDVTKGAVIIAEQHHEKLDGSGYPRGLKGAKLNDLARMSAIVDIFGALTDARSYKPAYPAEKAFAILESMENQLDQNMLAIFKDIFTSTQPAEGQNAATG